MDDIIIIILLLLLLPRLPFIVVGKMMVMREKENKMNVISFYIIYIYIDIYKVRKKIKWIAEYDGLAIDVFAALPLHKSKHMSRSKSSLGAKLA